MTEPWATIVAIVWLGLFIGAGGVLVYWAFRLKSPALVVLCVALVVWPIAGDVINALARHHVRKAVVAGDTSFIGLWGGTPGLFVCRVAWFVHVVQAGLVFAAAWAAVRLARRKEGGRDPDRVNTPDSAP